MNVYKHCETGAAGIFANWNYYNDELADWNPVASGTFADWKPVAPI
jgi:hypothetical protein